MSVIHPEIEARLRAEIRGDEDRQTLIGAVLIGIIIELAAYTVWRGTAPICGWLGL